MNIAHNLDQKHRTKDVLLEEHVSFDALLLSEKIQESLIKNGFQKPSPIQLKAIPLGRCGFDLIVKSKSGTGKTLVFSIIALEMLDMDKNQTQVLILVPTREIAVQIVDVIRILGSAFNGLQVDSFIGGLSVEDDVKKAKNCHIAVGTPGRLKQLITNGNLETNMINLFVLDEADKLMEKSFQNDINTIYYSLPKNKQIITTSATYPSEMQQFLSNYMLTPTQVSVEIDTPMLLGLKQFICLIKSQPNVAQQLKAKNDKLLELLTKLSFTQCLIFFNYQTRAESTSNMLNSKGWDSSYISAAQSQSKRNETMNDLKKFKCRILLSTDLTSRGIDASNVDLVINYDVPQDSMTYLHRIGRAGRYGSSGICLTLTLNGIELKQMQNILGDIGGNRMSIAKLPELTEIHDLINTDTNNFEQIYGTPRENSNKLQIKNEIQRIKESREIIDGNLCEINNPTEKIEEIHENYENLETSKTPDNTCKKRKTCDMTLSCDKSHDDDEKQDGNDKLGMLFKNKALLSVTKLLYDPSASLEEDLKSTLAEYRNYLKENDENLTINTENSVEEQMSGDHPQDIIQHAYEYATDSCETHWRTKVSREDQENYDRFCEEENASEEEIEDEEEEIEEEECEEEYQEMVTENAVDTNQDITKAWRPVGGESGDLDRPGTLTVNQHYTDCFQECSDHLWQNGLNFESVEEFDKWFYQWQLQVASVRNYVQQNIYVEELANLQRNKFSA